MKLFDQLFPRRCVFCGVLSGADETSICSPCYADLPWAQPPMEYGPFECVIVPLVFEFPADAAIKALKFRRRLYYVPALAEILCRFRMDLPMDIDAVLPVPLHWRRKAFRGFNQAEEIAKPVAKLLGLTVLKNVVRRRATTFQSGLPAQQREENLRGAFQVLGALSQSHVLIVDDVVTTGATTRSLARELFKYGVERVSVLAVART